MMRTLSFEITALIIAIASLLAKQCSAWIPHEFVRFGSTTTTRQRAPFPGQRLFRCHVVTPLQATSSSKLKKKNPKSSSSSSSASSSSTPKGPRGSVVERLSLAAAQAKAKVEKTEKAKAKKRTSSAETLSTQEEGTQTEKLASLQSLTAAIEAKLEQSRKRTINNQNRDAMNEVLRHNENVAELRPYHNATVKHVAILLTKPLQNDRITVEHANRVRRLVQAMIKDQYRPNVICFVGPQTPGNLVADADASYLFFQELCAAQHVSVHGIDIHLVKGSVQEGALEQISYFLKETCSPRWAMGIMQQQKQEFTGRLHVHFTLISSEYELCQLNDIHERSPGRSPLRKLTDWSSRSFETTWSYLYTTTILPPHEESNDVTRMFRTKTFRSAQELIPVLQHLRSVAENREFFQLEAYRVMVAARRSIVKDMELLYHRPKHLRQSVAREEQRRRQQEAVEPPPPSSSASAASKPIDVVLEAASLSLGRCLDLVRPAGRGSGVVSSADWRLAAVLLEKSISQIVSVCDTDGPLDPSGWGKLGYGDDDDDEDDVGEGQDAGDTQSSKETTVDVKAVKVQAKKTKQKTLTEKAPTKKRATRKTPKQSKKAEETG